MTEEKSITEEAAPAEATQVVEPIAIEAAQAGDTAVLEPAADVAAVSSGPDSVEEPVLENPAKPKKKRRKAPIIILIILVLLLGAAAALEFIPGSPFEHTIRWLIDPPTQATEQLS
ncbi:MAG: hypothetical protein IKF96_05180, partial [Eggerthellaceae bacterium]|nr:hypothetical protein [Eggerthellaceae bacterium]